MEWLLLAGIVWWVFQKKSGGAGLGEFIPVNQTVYGLTPEGKVNGNCFPACVASILGLPLEQVPFFTTESQDAQLADANRWLKQFRLQLVMEPNLGEFPLNQYYIIRGSSPRFPGYFHMVVGKDGRIVHDPHPDKTGIIGEPAHFVRFIKF